MSDPTRGGVVSRRPVFPLPRPGPGRTNPQTVRGRPDAPVPRKDAVMRSRLFPAAAIVSAAVAGSVFADEPALPLGPPRAMPTSTAATAETAVPAAPPSAPLA